MLSARYGGQAEKMHSLKYPFGYIDLISHVRHRFISGGADNLPRGVMNFEMSIQYSVLDVYDNVYN